MAGFPENVDDGVQLSLGEVDVSGDELCFAYEVRNGSDYRAYLVNRLFHRDPGGFRVDPNVVYAGVGDDGVLYLRKQLIEVPEDLDVEAPEVPYLTPLAVGESFSETVRVSLPVHLHDPYRPQPRGEKPREVDRWAFVLGYVLEDEPVAAREVELAIDGTEWRIEYSELRRRQRLVEVEGSSPRALTVASAL